MEEWMWLIWLLLAVLTLIIEASTVAVISIWFSLGSICALILSFFPSYIPYWAQIIVFFGVSIISFFALKPLIKKWMAKKEKTRNYVDSLIGMKGVVLTRVDSLHNGEIMVNGLTWTATTSTSSTFNEGEVAKIVAVEGNKLFISKTKEENKE
ncbi:MAG TPA: hypothetical protein DEF61_04945 [Firmicutes bacterium]|nr:hypothetical protein [Bacillota bacterium]HBX25574.1 hypothetical protein [Bacillota bacterium]